MKRGIHVGLCALLVWGCGSSRSDDRPPPPTVPPTVPSPAPSIEPTPAPRPAPSPGSGLDAPVPTPEGALHFENAGHTFQLGPHAVELRATSAGTPETGYQSRIVILLGTQIETLLDERTPFPSDVFAWSAADALVLHFLPADAGESDIYIRYAVVNGALARTGDAEVDLSECGEYESVEQREACVSEAYNGTPPWIHPPRPR